MKLQLKRSNQLVNGKAKEPTVANMEYGEIAINYNADDPVLFMRTSDDQIIRVTAIGLPDINDPNEQPGTLDDRYINRAGDTMVGFLTLNADPTANLHSATKQYVDTQISDIPIPTDITVGELPPGDPVVGQQWWCSTDGRLYIYYTDVDSSQWVPATPESENNAPSADGGLEIINSEYAIKVRPGYGVETSTLGLQIGNDWSNIPALPEV